MAQNEKITSSNRKVRRSFAINTVYCGKEWKNALRCSDVNPWPWDCGLGLRDLALAKKSRPLPKSCGPTKFTIVLWATLCSNHWS